MNILEEVWQKIIGKGDLLWRDGEFPYYNNRTNINMSKNQHKRRIMRMLVRGERITSKEYAEMPNGSTKFTTRLNEMEKETELPFTREWETNGKTRWLRYGLDIVKLKKEMK